jgi:hypothetical protein
MNKHTAHAQHLAHLAAMHAHPGMSSAEVAILILAVILFAGFGAIAYLLVCGITATGS